MFLRTARPWLSRPTRPIRKETARHRARPALEALEDRVVPAQQYVDLGPLRFFADFSQSGTQYTANGGDVQLGLKPARAEAFLPLLEFDLTAQRTPGVLRLDTTDTTTFEFTRAAVESVVQGPVVPLTIWQTSPNDTNLTKWDVNQLVSGNGLSVSGGQPFTARGVSFTLGTLILANPDGGSTQDAQVKMQGSATFTQLAGLDLSRLQAKINGDNYLITDTSGIHLTGLTVALTGGASFDVFGMTATLGNPSVTYTDDKGVDSFGFTIGASLQSKSQDRSQRSALENVGAELAMTLTGDNLSRLGFDVQGSFKIFDVSVATDSGNPLKFDFDFQDHQFEISGGLTVTIPTATASTVDVNLGYANDPAAPGIVIQNGKLTQFNASVNGTLNLAALQVTTNNNGLNFSYDRGQEQFEMYGDLTLTVPRAGGKNTSITAQMIDRMTGGPGLVIQGGELQQLDMSLNGQFDLFGLRVLVSNAGLAYDHAQDLYQISGTISAPQLWNASVELGTPAQPGIVIKDGRFHLDQLSIGLSDVNLGVFTVQQLQVSYSQPNPDVDPTLDVKVYLVFPAGWGVGGDLTFDGDKVNDITLFFTAGTGEGIEIGDTGLSLTYLEGSVQNIDDPHNIIVSGDIAFTYGGSITIYDPLQKQDITATLFAATGGFTVDRDHLQLDGSLYLGAYSTGTDSNGKPQYHSALGEDDSASVDLDWGAKLYTATASLSLYGGVIVVDGAFAFDETGDIVLAAKAELEVPSEIPIIGGKKLGSVDFLFEYHETMLESSFFAAWTEFEIPIIKKHVKIGVKYDIRHSHLSVLSGKQIDAFDGCFNHPEQCLDENGYYLYYSSYTAPEGASSATISVSWPFPFGQQYVAVTLPDGTQVDQWDFDPTTSPNKPVGLAVVPPLGSATQTVVHLTSSGPDVPLPGGNYTLWLYSDLEFDHSQVAFSSAFHFPEPTLDPVTLGSIPTDGTSLVDVTLKGTVDEGFKANTLVSLYVDVNNDPTHRNGVPVKGATALPITTDGNGNWTLKTTWDLSGLTPSTSYYLYALINDGINAQVLSDYTAGAQVVPPLDGQVIDVAPGHGNRPVPGIHVFLDQNRNDEFDLGEPTSVTNADGFYSFWDVEPNIPFNVAVVIPTGFELYTGDPLNTNPRTGLSYDGSHPVAADFSLIKLPSISGTVFNDLHQDGHLAPGDPGLGLWAVYLDANANGRLDDGEVTTFTAADGSYSFLDLTAGTYTVGVIVPPGYYQTSPTPAGSRTVTITPTAENPYPQITAIDFGALPFVSVSGNVSQYTLQDGALSPTTTPVQGQTVYLLAAKTPRLINAGGGAVDGYLADGGFSGESQEASTTHSVYTGAVVGAAPEAVYQSNRYGYDFSYAITGLTPGAAHTVRLHFAETYWDDPGDRIFNVAINGQTVLAGFDIFAAANEANNGGGGKFVAIARSFLATADDSGTITIHLTTITDNAQVNGIEILPQQTGGVAINAGGAGDAGYQADRGFSGGQSSTNPSAIDTSLVTNPAPQEVYQAYRHGGDFTYLVTGLTPGATHLVRLHFVEPSYTQTGQRLFGVQINGQYVLTDYDVFGAAGARNRAVVEAFIATADGNGTVTVTFFSFGNEALVNAIEVSEVVATTTTDAGGNYSFSGLRAGTYTVAQAVAPGTRQIAPFTSGLQLQTPQTSDQNPATVIPLFGPDLHPTSVAAGDFDNDGTQDFAVLNPAGTNNNQLQILYNAGNGNLLTLWVPQSDLLQLAVGDFYGTGRQDVAVLTQSGKIQIVRNEGGGGWDNGGTVWSTAAPSVNTYSMATGRFIGGIGRDQLAVLYTAEINSISYLLLDVLYIDDSGNLQRITSWLPDNYNDDTPGSMVAGDIFGNPTQEELLIGFGQQAPLIGYFGGTNVFDFQPVEALPAGNTVVMGDINGDGLTDLGVFDSNTAFHYTLQDQGGNFDADYSPNVGPATNILNAAQLRDVNGDFRPDLVFVSGGNGSQQALYVALNTAQTGNWFSGQTQWNLAPGGQAGLGMDVGDFNGDGLNDIVVTDQAGGFVEVVYNRSVTAPAPFIVPVVASDSGGNDFVNVQLGQISGRVFDDVSRDGTDLLGKPARPGVTVYVDLNGNGRRDRGEPTSVTGPHGYYAFAGLPAGRYQVRWLDEPDRRPTTSEGGVHVADLSDPTRALTGLDFGNAVRVDATLTIPAAGSGDWTVLANGGRLEVLDRVQGVVYSRPLAELHSLSVTGTNRPGDRLTIDLLAGGFFALPGGLTFQGGRGDELPIQLGVGNDTVTVEGAQARINDRLTVHWTGGVALELRDGAGDDTYALATQNSTVRIEDRAGVDTLDFGRAVGGVAVDLARDGGQEQHIGQGNRLYLSGVFENVIGSAFADDLSGNAADNLIRGGDGDDVIHGGAGRDVLIGGLGTDVLFGGPGQDLLIGGTTAFDDDELALRAVLAEWTSRRGYAERVRNLTGTGSGDRANGNTYLNSGTVFDDHAVDVLFGGPDRDWFLSFPTDLLPDRRRDERVGW